MVGLQNTVTTAVLAVAILLLCRVKNLSPAVRHGLWCVALVKLLLPPLITWPWPVADLGSTLVPTGTLAGAYQDSPKTASTNVTDEPAVGSGALLQQPTWDTPEPFASKELIEQRYVPTSDPEYTKWDVVVFEEVLVVPDVDKNAAAPPTILLEPATPAATRWPFNVAQSLVICWLTGSLLVLLLQALRIIRMQHVCRNCSPAPG